MISVRAQLSFPNTKNYFEQFGVILVLFFNNEADDAVKKDKTIFISNFTEEQLVSPRRSAIAYHKYVKLDMDPEL